MAIPGVFVKEFDMSNVVVPGTSGVAAFAGEFQKGPGGEAVLVTNTVELEEIFGRPNNSNYNQYFQAHQFLSYGAAPMYISRAIDWNGYFTESTSKVTSASQNEVEVDKLDTSIQEGVFVKFDREAEDKYQVQEVRAANAALPQITDITINQAVDNLDYTVTIMGVAYTYRSITGDTEEDIASGLFDSLNGNNFNIVLNGASITFTSNPGFRVAIVSGSQNLSVGTAQEAQDATGVTLVLDTEEDLTTLAPAGSFVLVYGQAYNAVALVPDNGVDIETTELVKERILIKNDSEYDSVEDSIPLRNTAKLKLIARNPGKWGNSIRVSIGTQAEFDNDEDALPGSKFSSLFDTRPLDSEKQIALVVSVDGVIKERFLGSFDPNAKNYLKKSMFIEDIVTAGSSLIYVVANTSEDVTVTPGTYKLQEGSDGEVGIGEINEAHEVFLDVETLEFDTIIANELSRSKAGDIANTRQDCMAYVGPTSDIVGKSSSDALKIILEDVQTGEAASGSLSTNYCAYFGNYFQIYDSFNDKTRWISPAGNMAGLFAKTSRDLYPWIPSAGETYGNVSNILRLSFNYNAGQREKAYQAKVNPITVLTGKGTLVYGQKTLQAKMSAFDRINVRRLVNYIKRDMKKSLEGFIFEFNDENTRARVRATLNPYLESIVAKKGITEFLVVCDETNNTPQIISANEMQVSVALRPNYVAEELVLNIFTVGGGLTIEEALQ